MFHRIYQMPPSTLISSCELTQCIIFYKSTSPCTKLRLCQIQIFTWHKFTQTYYLQWRAVSKDCKLRASPWLFVFWQWEVTTLCPWVPLYLCVCLENLLLPLSFQSTRNNKGKDDSSPRVDGEWIHKVISTSLLCGYPQVIPPTMAWFCGYSQQPAMRRGRSTLCITMSITISALSLPRRYVSLLREIRRTPPSVTCPV